MTAITGKLFVYFFWGHISLKNRTYCPLLATIQALSKTRVFLLSKKKRRLLCMGRTSTANRGNNKKNGKNSLKIRGVSWESNPARVKASGRGAKF
jgi:hypothetical protein